MQGVTHAAVNKRAKRDGWTRDLAARVRQRAEEKVNAARDHENLSIRFPREVSKKEQVLDQASVESHAEAITRVRLRHEKGIRDCGEHLDRLFEELAILGAKGDGTAIDSLFEQIGLLKELTSVLSTVIAIERKAFRLDDAPDAGARGRTSLPIRFVSPKPYEEDES